MPIYEYKCEDCNNCFEKLVFSPGSESIKCPKCRSKRVTRLMSYTNICSQSGSGKCSSSVPGEFS
jgi:putative FmdB family regulatory protein